MTNRPFKPDSPAFDGDAQLLDLAFDAVFARRPGGLEITYWSPGAERTYGWTREEALGRRQPDLLRTEYPVEAEVVELELATRGRWSGRLAHRARDGTRVTVSSRLVLLGGGADGPSQILEMDSAATDEVEAVRGPSRYEDLLELLVESVREYAIFVLDPQGHVVTWNAGAERLKQYTRDEILGQHFSVFYEPEKVRIGHPDWELDVARRQGQYEEEGWRLRKDGSRFWASVVITALHDERGELRGFAKVTRDMTEKHVETQRLRELEGIKSMFLRLVSHELRGPLATLRGYTSILREGELEEVEAYRTAYEVIDNKARHMHLLVNQMLEAARLEDGRMQLSFQELDLREPVRQAVRDTRILAASTHGIELDEPSSPIHVRGDSFRLMTVVQNLLDNAVKYSPGGGTVRCRVDVERGAAVVAVVDTGLGIAADDLPTLFTRFGRIVTRENSHIPGAGLGLYLCREMARMHGGDLTVQSEPGKGSTFTLTLPLA